MPTLLNEFPVYFSATFRFTLRSAARKPLFISLRVRDSMLCADRGTGTHIKTL